MSDVRELADFYLPPVGPEGETEKEQQEPESGMEKDTEEATAEEAMEEMDSTLQES